MVVLRGGEFNTAASKEEERDEVNLFYGGEADNATMREGPTGPPSASNAAGSPAKSRCSVLDELDFTADIKNERYERAKEGVQQLKERIL